MKHDIILAGVGGQGILTLSRAICTACLRRGLNIRQAEVHGMAQRGGAVQSHLRISDAEIYGDLIPLGAADLIIAIEPLEALRYAHYLNPDGAIVAATNAFVNIENYPPVEETLDRIAEFPRHALIDAERLARAAGSPRAANAVVLGAAVPFVDLEIDELEDALAEIFEPKGQRIVELNQRALRFGRNAARAYCDAMHRGGRSRAVRHWIETIPAEHLDEPPAGDAVVDGDGDAQLTGAEAHAVRRMLEHVHERGRKQLFEHEVYTLVALVGAISPPRYAFIPRGEQVQANDLAPFHCRQLVLKIVSPQIVHKTEAKGLVFVPNDLDTVRREMRRLIDRHAENAEVEGVLIVEYVERRQPGFGNELFVGIRATREFGPVIAAGLGGIDTEYLASKMEPGLAVAKAPALDTSADEFLDLFRRTAAYDILAGRARGHERIVSDGELLRCFRAFLAIAREFCVHREGQPALEELEVNPFAFRRQRMMPLDGRGRLGDLTPSPPARSTEQVAQLLEPRSIAVLGASATSVNVGRMILNNILRAGFPREHLYVVKQGHTEIDGVRCIETLEDAPEPIDLLVLAAGAAHLPDLIDQVADAGNVRSCILIPGGVGETEGTDALQAEVGAAVARARAAGGTVFLGPNCLGVRSRPGRYDTFFIPPEKLATPANAAPRRCALVSQSGAFMISRLSNLEFLDPALSVSIGNQIDLTLSDVLAAVGTRDDIDVIGVYAEGFNALDGLAFLRTVKKLAARGKLVIFYKAGRTPTGRAAAAGHTAAVAGDYDICQAAAAQAGALVVDTFKEFEQILEIATTQFDKPVGGTRIGAISNAGCETVAMADAILGRRYAVEMAQLDDEGCEQLRKVLREHDLDRLVNARNPLDVTPMASDAAIEACARVLLSRDQVDALVVSTVPLSAALKTTPQEVASGGSLAERLPKLAGECSKPMIYVVDSGPLFDELARTARRAGIPTFRSCDQAIRSLGRYLCHRAPRRTPPAAHQRPEKPPVRVEPLPIAPAHP
ncbi:MAG: indolepyruvate oxidoreductase subunit beta [Planctomycetota bacterium]|nr:MAG: indolepyruvate oxidoreductase subunit beta [Planctomycetota bacterium]